MSRGGFSRQTGAVPDETPQALGAAGVPGPWIPRTVNDGEIARRYAGEGGSQLGGVVLAGEVVGAALQVGTVLLGVAAQLARDRHAQSEELRASTMALVARSCSALKERFPQEASALQGRVSQALRGGAAAVAQLARALISNPNAVLEGAGSQASPTVRAELRAGSAAARSPSVDDPVAEYRGGARLDYSLAVPGARLANAGSAPNNNPVQAATPWDRQAFEQALINRFAGSAGTTYESPYEALAANGGAVQIVRRQPPATQADVRRIDNEIAARNAVVSGAAAASALGNTWKLDGYGATTVSDASGPEAGLVRGLSGAPRSVMEGPAPWTENAGRVVRGLWDTTAGALIDVPKQYYDIFGALRSGPSEHQPVSALGQAANSMSPGELGTAVLQATLGAPSNLVIDALDGNWYGVGSNLFGTATLAGGYVAGIRGLQAPSFGPRYYQLLFTQNAQDFVGGLTRADRMALGVQYERTQGLINSIGQYGGQSASQVYMRAFDANGNLLSGSVRLDSIGVNPSAPLGFDFLEYKLTRLSPLTDHQALHFPNFELYGGVVTGLRARDIGLPQGRIIPPFRVDVRTGPLPTKPGE